MGAIIDDLLRLSQVTHADMNLVPVDLSAEVAADRRGPAIPLIPAAGSASPSRRASG